MATAYSTDLRSPVAFATDSPWTAETLPNTTSKSSSAFRFGKLQAGCELVITANTAIAIADTKSITIELLWDKSATGSFSNSRVIKAFSASGSTLNIAKDYVLGRIIPETDVDHYCKIKITATADQSAGKVDAKIYPVA